MEQKAIDILNAHRVMTIATVRADGWPQATMVGYVNDKLQIYFVISRRSQKFENLGHDDRASIAIGSDFSNPAEIRGLSIAAHVSEVTDPAQRKTRYAQLVARHPEFAELGTPEFEKAAIMRATCTILSIIDYEKGFGHTDLVRIGISGILEMQPARPDDWGFTPSTTRKGSYERWL